MPELMTMRDIAGLARVQRPVVTTWRKRSRGSAHPFPSAREHRDGQELFLREDIVDWLEATRRGNSTDVRADAAAFALLSDGSARAAEALSALLTLRHLIGGPLAELSADDLLDLADEHDPDDRYLLREVTRSRNLGELARTADDLVDAAWDAPQAHRRLMESRLRAPGTALARTALSDPGRRLLLGLVGPLARELDEPTVMDATGAAVDVLAELAASLELPAALIDGDSPAHRLVRRQLLVADRPFRAVERDGGSWSMTGPVTHVLVVPSAALPGADALEQLDLIEEVALQLDDQQLALCLAPSATLADPLTGPGLTRRDQLLRGGYVRAVVRLPAGLRPAFPREHSALWLLGSPDSTGPAERRTLVADLGHLTLPDCDGLADDLLAAWQGVDGARRRAWAHLHPVLTRDLISASGTLTPARPTRAQARPRNGADWVVDLRAADREGRLAGYRLDVAAGTPELVTVGQALERGWLRVLPGRRVHLDGLPSGSVPVVDSTALPSRTVDRLALLARSEVELTEPGDIIFDVRPNPHARLDEEGGTLVLAPARVLRVRSNAPLLARAILARINAAGDGQWRNWTISVLPEPDCSGLGEALTELSLERVRLLAELAALDALSTDLITAVESRQLSISKENHGPTSH